jgi:GntR family transcriptional regulator / MocR family aminotransferase
VDVHVSLTGPGARADRIYRQLSEAILGGRLRTGERLPPTRSMAASLGVSRGTVSAAYDRLLAEGLATARTGAGTFVADVAPAPRTRGRRTPSLRPGRTWEALPEPPARGPAARYDFSAGVPDPALFPWQQWRRYLGEAATRPTRDNAAYGDPSGLERLRAAIARHIALSRAVHASADDVLVTSGAQQALALTAQVLLKAGDVVAVEEPGYPLARAVFAAHGARVVGVPVDADGLRVSDLPSTTALVYTTPSHQFPLGMAMSPRRRADLLRWAAEHRAALVEDDYDSEFRYGQRSLDSLHSIDREERVVYVGTFSKSLLPSLRVGYMVAPTGLRSALRKAKWLGDWHGDLLTQHALAALMESGIYASHVRRCQKRYAARHGRLTELLARDFASALEVVPSAAGLHVAAHLSTDSRRSAQRIAQDALGVGVRVPAIDDFYLGAPTRSGLVLGFGALPDDRVGAALRALARVLSGNDSRPIRTRVATSSDTA